MKFFLSLVGPYSHNDSMAEQRMFSANIPPPAPREFGEHFFLQDQLIARVRTGDLSDVLRFVYIEPYDLQHRLARKSAAQTPP